MSSLAPAVSNGRLDGRHLPLLAANDPAVYRVCGLESYILPCLAIVLSRDIYLFLFLPSCCLYESSCI